MRRPLAGRRLFPQASRNNRFVNTTLCLVTILLLFVLLLILISPNNDSFLTALQGKEKARIVFLGIALAAMFLVGFVAISKLFAVTRTLAVLNQERSVYPPLHLRECVLLC